MPPATLPRRYLLSLLGLGGLMTVPDFPDEAVPDAHARAISLTGAPPLVLKQVIDALIGQNIPAGGTLTRPASGKFPLNQPGYEIQINVATLAATAPVLSVELQWYDSAFNGLVDSEIYYFYSGDASGHFIHGRGPTKGDRVVVVISNYSTASGVTFSYTLLQTSRTFTREFWKTITKAAAQPVFPGFVPALGNIEAGVLMEFGVTIGAASAISRVLPLYTGSVSLFGLTSSVTVGQNTWEFDNNTSQVGGGAFDAEGANGESGFAPLGPTSLYFPRVTLPRAQMTMRMVNNATTSNQMSAGIYALEDRS